MDFSINISLELTSESVCYIGAIISSKKSYEYKGRTYSLAIVRHNANCVTEKDLKKHAIEFNFLLSEVKEKSERTCARIFWRCWPDLNWRITVLQTGALPLGYSTMYKNRNATRSYSILLERVTRLELATSTLARWRSTGLATPASGLPIGNLMRTTKSGHKLLVPPVGSEPTTRGFSVHCSTD